jgi:hypothetical protein
MARAVHDAAPAVPKGFALDSSPEGAQPSVSVGAASWIHLGHDGLIAGDLIVLARRVDSHAITPPNPGAQIEIA